jgi:broad specificity phosphatase PhoE
LRLFVLARHAHSVLNVEHRVNGDPGRPVPLTEEGREEARALGVELANLPLDVCIHTRFLRTRDTATLALEGRDVPFEVEPLFDDVDVGELEGFTIDEYRAWKAEHARSDPFPGGESLDDSAHRYARGFRGLLEGDHDTILVVCHEIPIRYALNAAAGSEDLDGPVHEILNARPYLFDDESLARAAEGIERLVSL